MEAAQRTFRVYQSALDLSRAPSCEAYVELKQYSRRLKKGQAITLCPSAS
jgi:hypothetical protein